MLAAANAPDPALLTVVSNRAQQIGRLRQAVAEIERGHGRSKPSFGPLGVPEAHDRLASLGLACGVLHEVSAAAHADRPAAFGIMFALIASALRVRAPLCSLPLGGRWASSEDRMATACASWGSTPAGCC